MLHDPVEVHIEYIQSQRFPSINKIGDIVHFFVSNLPANPRGLIAW